MLGGLVEDHSDGSFAYFRGMLTRSSHGPHPPSEWALRPTRYAQIAADDVARVVAALLENSQPHIGKIYYLTGPQSENMHFYAQEYSKAPGRTITYQDIPVEPWRDALRERGFPVHVVNHLTTMADLHRAGRFDRMSEEVLMLTGQQPVSVQAFVGNNAAAFTLEAPTMASA